MKKNHDKIIQYINAALKECGQDYALSDAKHYLNQALSSIKKTKKKRTVRENMIEDIRIKTLQKKQQWWEKIKEGIRNHQLESLDNDANDLK